MSVDDYVDSVERVNSDYEALLGIDDSFFK